MYVENEKVEYSEEIGGYSLPADAFRDPSNPPSIKIYATDTAPVGISYLVEPGISFSAMVDGKESSRITMAPASAVQLLPGTEIAITATAADSDEVIFIEIGGEIVAEGSDLNYTFTVGTWDQTISIKHKKLTVTVKCDEEWSTVSVNGAGFAYPMYDAESELEFPLGTTELYVITGAENRHVVKVLNAATGEELPFDVATGRVSGIEDKMQLSIVIGDYVRNRALMVYLDENSVDDSAVAALVLASGKVAAKEVTLLPGYQEILFADTDLPLAIRALDGVDTPFAVYLNNEEIPFSAEAGYAFPATITDNSVVKIFTERQSSIKVEYKVNAPYHDVTVTHDRNTDIDYLKAHTVLPGTEITLRLTPRTAQSMYAMSRTATDTPIVTLNGEKLTPVEDGLYTIKATSAHAPSGILVAVNPENDGSTGIDEVMGGSTAVDVYDLRGNRLLKAATRADIDRLPAGVYIIGGRKVLLNR